MKFQVFKSLLICALVVQTHAVSAQKKSLSLEEIWSGRKFSPEYVYGMNPLANGKTYAQIVDGSVLVYSYQTGDALYTLLDANELKTSENDSPFSLTDYVLSQDETKLLFETETEMIYRHSTKSNYYIYDLKAKKLQPLSMHGKQQLATFSPDGTKVAFVRDNNIYYTNLTTNEEIQITFDGKANEIINGAPDWVYEEEFSFSQAFFWSADSKKIAFIRFDESKVKEFQLTTYGPLYPEQYKYKYPKAGEDNSVVSVHVYNLESKKTLTMQTGTNTDIYIPRIQWTQNNDILSITRLNRHQNQLEILLADVQNGMSRVLYEEKNPRYIELSEDVQFLPDGEHCLITSEKSGRNQIYLYKLDGSKTIQLTTDTADVTKVYGFDEKNKKVYYQAAYPSPRDRSIFSTDLKGKTKLLVDKPGHNNAQFSSDFTYFVNTNSTINTPYYISVFKTGEKELRILKDNKNLSDKLSEYHLPKFEFFSFTDSIIRLPDGTTTSLHAWKLLPPDFDPAKKYPVLIYIYGGPGAQTVNNAWGGANNLWFQHLAQKGIIIVSVDNRGTGARGELFKKMTYKELGKYETEDLIATAKYLGQLSYVDAEKIAVFGWSYGGYMSSLAITKGADYFAGAIAVAPVTNWRYYDNIYTERYMQLPVENAEGYDNNSPVNHVDKIKGKYLLVHGSGDDNVHYQNSMEMINALVKANKQFDLMIYPNRNHGIYGGNTRLHLYTKMNRFLESLFFE